MKSPRWYTHLPKEEQESFKKRVTSCKDVLRRLNTILEDEYKLSDREMHKRENFFMPAWAEKQAFELGYQKALKTILKLTEV